ncbi:MAG: DUF493 domain-containing protein [Burkholderiaceae bacterium]|nr:DUF493 domain-containing protein [Burkholderiaceae bacterium]
MDKKELLEFPCVFPLKVMGLKHAEFKSTIGDVVKQHAADFDPSTITTRDSAGGKYEALAVTINAQSREQLDGLYMALTKHPMVKVVL